MCVLVMYEYMCYLNYYPFNIFTTYTVFVISQVCTNKLYDKIINLFLLFDETNVHVERVRIYLII